MNTPAIPEPVEDVDFYTDELRRYTVCIDIEIDGLVELDSEADICLRAVDGFRDGSLDSDANIMHSERIKDVELDFKTDLPFNRGAWRKAKMLELGLNENGMPLRPGEKERPANEQTFECYCEVM